MQITAGTLADIAGTSVNANMRSAIAGLGRAGVGAGLNRPHRLAHFLGQVAHESMGWHYDREVWGPSAAQKRYESRADLGNAQPGDGSKFRGYTPMQITGRANTTDFRDWCRKIDPGAPDFAETPELMNTDPWEGLGPIWFWDTRGLNALADANDLLAITKRINGGTNGLADRQARTTRAGLVLLGFPTVKLFQVGAGLKADGIAGPQTRAAIHARLLKQPLVTFSDPPLPPEPPSLTLESLAARVAALEAAEAARKAAP